MTDTLHTVHGIFPLKEGHFSFDPDASAMSGDIVVDAASADRRSGARDKRIKHDILEAQRFPEIRFSPTTETGRVAANGVFDVKVTGSFFIHGQAHELTIPMHVNISGTELVAKGTFLVPYVEWGMKNPSNLLIKVNDKVAIDLTAIRHLNPAKTSKRRG